MTTNTEPAGNENLDHELLGREDELMTGTAQQPRCSTVLGGLLRRAGRETGYLLLSLPLAIAEFTVFVLGISLGAALLVTFLGLPVLAGALLASHGLGRFERGRLDAFGYPVVRTRHFSSPERGIRRIVARLRHGQS